MKALTLQQPWASLVAPNAKPYEFRSRSYLASNRIAIHAGAAGEA